MKYGMDVESFLHRTYNSNKNGCSLVTNVPTFRCYAYKIIDMLQTAISG